MNDETQKTIVQPRILFIGGANTGRSPMAAALLTQLLAKEPINWVIESAGVTSHDDDPAEPEAWQAMNILNMDITEHSARSLSEDIVQTATILIAIDTGIKHVIHQLFPSAREKTYALGELANLERNIPDPFRMQVVTWVTYAKEMQSMLHKGLERLKEIVATHSDDSSTASHATQAATISVYDTAQTAIQDDAETQTDTLSYGNTPITQQEKPLDEKDPSQQSQQTDTTRSNSIERCEQIFRILRDMPRLIDWAQGKIQVKQELQSIATISLAPDEPIQPYINMLLAIISMQEETPSSGQCEIILESLKSMYQAIDTMSLTRLSLQLAQWAQRHK